VAFVLIASLGPTDDVAVASITNIVKVPYKIMNILRGESMLNDISGIVSFQFALAAVVTSSFSIFSASWKFLIVGFGGVLIGVLFSTVIYVFVKWMLVLRIKNITLHIFIELLSPFLVYLMADYFGVSPIIAVFTSGVIHSFSRNRLSQENTNLNTASDNVWDMVSFSLEGLVFLLLGTQMPEIIKTMWSNSYCVSNIKIIEVVLLITASFILTRFLWAFFTIPSKHYNEKDNSISKTKASLIISLSGARGAVTLASVMTIPLLINNGAPFPQRDLIILISIGIIICSLLVTNFILPLFMEKKTEIVEPENDNKTYIKILNNTIIPLNNK
jgi:CPA1 family monovalent cation:H+ antiporter